MKTNKLPEIGSYVELYAPFDQKWVLSKLPVIAHGKVEATNHPYFTIGEHLRARVLLKHEGEYWRHPQPPKSPSNALQKVLEKLAPKPKQILLDALKALPDNVLETLAEAIPVSPAPREFGPP